MMFGFGIFVATSAFNISLFLNGSGRDGGKPSPSSMVVVVGLDGAIVE